MLAARPAARNLGSRRMHSGHARFGVLLRASPKPPDRGGELGDTFTARRHGLENRGTPLFDAVSVQRQVRLNGRHERVLALAVRLVDDVDVLDLLASGL